MDIGDNITSLKDVEDQEAQDPSVPIITKGSNGIVSSIVYKSRPTLPEFSGHPILTDFGQMRQFEGCVNSDWWMPDLYRAPEVLLGLPWSFPVDIWSIGVMVSTAFPHKSIFLRPQLKYSNIDARADGRQKPLRPGRPCEQAVRASAGYGTVHRLSRPSSTGNC